MSESVHNIDLAKCLGVSPKKIIRFLLVALGSKVAKGDILAQKKNLLKTIYVKAPFDATLISLNEEGIILLEKSKDKNDTDDPASGQDKKHDKKKVSGGEIYKKTANKIKNSQKASKPQKEVEDSAKDSKEDKKIDGMAFILKEEKLFDLNADMADSFLFCSFVPTDSYIFKAEAVGVNGIFVLAEDAIENLTFPAGVEMKLVFLNKKDYSWTELEKMKGKKVSFSHGKFKLL